MQNKMIRTVENNLPIFIDVFLVCSQPMNLLEEAKMEKTRINHAAWVDNVYKEQHMFPDEYLSLYHDS